MSTAINALEHRIKVLRKKKVAAERAVGRTWVEAENLREQSAKLGAAIANCHAAINPLESRLRDNGGGRKVNINIPELPAKKIGEWVIAFALSAVIGFGIHMGIGWIDEQGHGGLVAKVLDYGVAAALVFSVVTCTWRGPLQAWVAPMSDNMERIAKRADEGDGQAMIAVAIVNAGTRIAVLPPVVSSDLGKNPRVDRTAFSCTIIPSLSDYQRGRSCESLSRTTAGKCSLHIGSTGTLPRPY